MTSYSVGAVLPSRTFTVTRADVRRYAQASGDVNPIHLDDEAARRAGLPRSIAHGMLLMGLVGSVASEWAGRADRVQQMSCRFADVVTGPLTVT